MFDTFLILIYYLIFFDIFIGQIILSPYIDLDAFFATDTAGGLVSFVRRLRGRDLLGLANFCAGAIVVEVETEATLVCDAVGAGREGVVGRGSSDFFEAAPALSGC